MNDTKVFNEIALNRREVVHPDFGRFLIRRPNSRVESELETVKTRSVNKDLQTKDLVYDPDTGDKKFIPAFLTRSSKKRLLEEHGEWSKEDEENIEKHEAEYVSACRELNDAGYASTGELFDSLKSVKAELDKMVEEKGLSEELKEELLVLVPSEEIDADSEVDLAEYHKARNKVERSLMDLRAVSVLEHLDKVHKQYVLYVKGLKAQSSLLLGRLKEYNLFSDTIEERASSAQRLQKIVLCTLDPDTGKQVWKNRDECEEESTEKVSWILSQIEKMEKLQGNDEEEFEKFDRFNFLSPNSIIKELSDASQEDTTSSDDGKSAEKQQEDSTAP